MAWQGSLTEHQLHEAEAGRDRSGVPVCERPHGATCWCVTCEESTRKPCPCVDCKAATIGEGGQVAPHPRNGPSWSA